MITVDELVLSQLQIHHSVHQLAQAEHWYIYHQHTENAIDHITVLFNLMQPSLHVGKWLATRHIVHHQNPVRSPVVTATCNTCKYLAQCAAWKHAGYKLNFLWRWHGTATTCCEANIEICKDIAKQLTSHLISNTTSTCRHRVVQQFVRENTISINYYYCYCN